VADLEIRPALDDDQKAVYHLIAGNRSLMFGGDPELTFGQMANIWQLDRQHWVAVADGSIVGAAGLSSGEYIDLDVRPDMRRRGIGTALLREVEDEAGHVLIRAVACALDPAGAAFLVANGFEKAWDYWLMGIDLRDELPPPRWPEDVIVRTFRAEDAVEVKELLDIAYAAEPDFRERSFDDWRQFMLGDPSFDPGCWFLAEADGELVAAALNWKEGYVKDIVVHPEHRRRGLGEALMRHTFREFRRRGAARVTLKTDSTNPTEAWRLYERLGMGYERTYEVFEKQL
jgi:mycothiol synthase